MEHTQLEIAIEHYEIYLHLCESAKNAKNGRDYQHAAHKLDEWATCVRELGGEIK